MYLAAYLDIKSLAVKIKISLVPKERREPSSALN
jgi:hypothetical protein